MRGLREWVATRGGRILALALVMVAGAGLTMSIRHWRAGGEAGRISRDRLFICSQTARTFRYPLAEGATIPVPSPYSRQATGFPAELCYWTADGQTRVEPTPVLLNVYLGRDEPTFCPDCGRRVLGHNPAPRPGMRPPPTREELATGEAHDQ